MEEDNQMRKHDRWCILQQVYMEERKYGKMEEREMGVYTREEYRKEEREMEERKMGVYR